MHKYVLLFRILYTDLVFNESDLSVRQNPFPHFPGCTGSPLSIWQKHAILAGADILKNAENRIHCQEIKNMYFIFSRKSCIQMLQPHLQDMRKLNKDNPQRQPTTTRTSTIQASIYICTKDTYRAQQHQQHIQQIQFRFMPYGGSW